jgi:hypothetical protein
MSALSTSMTMRTPKEINGVILRRVMPLLIAAYIMAFLDRTNIGMAKDRLEIDLASPPPHTASARACSSLPTRSPKSPPT